MKFTNEHNLPEMFARAVMNDPYKGGGDISVTSLIAPVRQRTLMHKHFDEIEEDVSSRVWALLGQSVHSVLERSGGENAIVEKRLSMKILDWEVTGQTDYYEDGQIVDAKVTSAWALMPNEKVKPDWVNQLNCYAELWRANGYKVRSLSILGIIRDWSKHTARRNENYPQVPVVIKKVKLNPRRKTQEYMEERVRLHKHARGTGELPDCTPDERWHKKEQWAIMHPGRKRAIRLYDTLKGAESHMFSVVHPDRKPLSIQHRPGESVRCNDYCAVKSFCSQYKEGRL